MRKLFFFLSISLSCLFAEVQNVELLATTVTKTGEKIEAIGEVVVYSERYLITADRAIYDEKNGDLELFGNINMLRGTSESSRSQHARINLKTDEGDFQPFFLFDQHSDIWIQCESAIGGPAYYLTQKSIVSSCNVQDPDWKIGFSSGRLNRQTSFLHLYNTLFYIQDIPVFYLPYFAFSTDKTRRTGLLIPTIGYGRDEGIFYQQPIYIAENQMWDLELDPQIRTERGIGIYSTLRFADSAYSSGSVTVGHFTEEADYARSEDLKNRSHMGYEVEYERNRLVSHLVDGATKDGLWIDFTYLNDIDYLNLKDNKNKSLSSLVTSRLNYYINRDNDYFGIYGKYYINTSKVSNDDTLQELPTVQYHRFSDNLLIPNLLYSLDTQYHRYDRKKDVAAQQYELNVPITLYFSLFDEFLNVSISENIYATHVTYDRRSDVTEDFSRNYHKFSLYTDLAKAYEDFYHTMYLGVDYIVPSWDSGQITEDFISTDVEHESLTAKLVQYFYDTAGTKRVRHAVSQPYYLEDSLYKYGDLENELAFFISSELTIKNEFNYSHEYKRLSKFQSSVVWNPSQYMARLSHTYTHDATDTKENFLTASFTVNHGKYYSTYGSVDYDFEDNYMNSWQIGLTFKKKCWDYTLIYKEDVSPKLTSAGTDSVKNRGIFIMFNLLPIGGGVKYNFNVEEE